MGMKIHHTKNKGDLGKLKVKCDLCEKGFLVLDTESEHSPFDIVAYKDKTFKRVQVKYRTSKKGKLQICYKTCWNDRHGTHIQPIDKSEVDVIAIYCPDTQKCYYFSTNTSDISVTLRLDSPKNGQIKGIRFADEYLDFPI